MTISIEVCRMPIVSLRYGLQDGSFGVLAVNSSEGPGPAGYLRDLRDLTCC